MFFQLRSIYTLREIVWNLAKTDFRQRYLGSVLGMLWAFLMPLVNLGVMWFAFEFGFKASPKNEVPFILWLVTGMFPWVFFTDAVQSSTFSIIEKSFLVKKVVFNVELLPIIKIVAALIPFIFLNTVMVVMFVGYGHGPSLFWFQLGYYAFCLLMLILAIANLTSAVVVFYRDLGQVVSMLLQLGFWGTPIFWSAEQLPEKLQIYNFLNPVSYVVTGYRETFISHKWFWENINQTIYFWCVVVLLSVLGQAIFKKLRPHFADVL